MQAIGGDERPAGPSPERWCVDCAYRRRPAVIAHGDAHRIAGGERMESTSGMFSACSAYFQAGGRPQADCGICSRCGGAGPLPCRTMPTPTVVRYAWPFIEDEIVMFRASLVSHCTHDGARRISRHVRPHHHVGPRLARAGFRDIKDAARWWRAAPQHTLHGHRDFPPPGGPQITGRSFKMTQTRHRRIRPEILNATCETGWFQRAPAEGPARQRKPRECSNKVNDSDQTTLGGKDEVACGGARPPDKCVRMWKLRAVILGFFFRSVARRMTDEGFTPSSGSVTCSLT